MSREDRHPREAAPGGFSLADGPLKPPERGPATLAHLVSLLPLWGVVFAGGVSYYYRGNSRAVAFQARQAIVVHLAFLAVGTAGILIRLLATLLDTAFPGIGFEAAAEWFDSVKAVGLYVVFCFFPVAAATLCAMGYNIVYPWIGPHLRQEPGPREVDEIYG